MATKPAAENVVNERRLRPIYDSLDNGNNKKAYQEAVKLLKKQENFHCAKVLKALALIRLGKQDESLSILEEVHQEHVADESTLLAMGICYLELQKLELIADAYENALKKDPQNEEFLSHLFMAYVRLGAYKKQQQTAMQLYKVKPKNPYYFWAVMSIVMQARTSDEKLAKSMYLPLAQKMTEKLVDDGKIEAEAEVELYLMILNLQDKYEDALKVLDGPLSALIKSSSTVPQRKAVWLEKLARWPEANAAFKNLLIEKPDNWAFYNGYFSSLFKIIEEKRKNESNGLDSTKDEEFSQALSFVKWQITRKGCENLRGPFLAKMELLKIAETKEWVNRSHHNECFPQLIAEYFIKFGSKMCFFSDIKNYIDHLKEEEQKELIETLEKKFDFIKTSNHSAPSQSKEIQMDIAFLQICHYLNLHDEISMNQKFELIEILMKKYKSSLKTVTDLPITDVHPGTDYCIIAVHILVDIWIESKDDSVLIKAIVCLEFGLSHSPMNHQFKLMLIKLYNKIGAIVPAYLKYNSMDVKHIQLDTIGYVITRYLTSYSYYSAACTVFGNTLRFFDSNYRETIDYLISSYKYGSFNKIYEFVQFRTRLNNSLQFSKIETERMILDLIIDTYSHETIEQVVQFMNVEPNKDKINWDNLIDNRDVNVMMTWKSTKMEQTSAQSLQNEIKWLKLRSLIVRAIAASVHLTKSNASTTQDLRITNGVQSEMSNILQSLLDQLSDHINILKETNFKTKWTLTGSYDSRLVLYLRDDIPTVILEYLKLVLHLYNASELKCESSNEKILSNINDKLQNLTSECTKSMKLLSQISNWSKFLESVTNLVEAYSFVLIILGSYQRILNPHKVSSSKRGKKKNKDVLPSKMNDYLISYGNMIKELEASLKDLNKIVTNIQFDQLSEQFTSIKTEISKESDSEDLNDFYSVVQTSIKDSYQTSLKELSTLIQHKLKYFSSIKL